MTRFYRFIDISEREVCINPRYVSAIHQNQTLDCYTIEMVGGRSFHLKADINILCDAIEMTANNKVNYGK